MKRLSVWLNDAHLHLVPQHCSACFRGKPYVIVFVGVNGVGKSTNLAKIAYWLVQNQMKV